MRLWILSDLHLGALRRARRFRPDPPAFDVLIVAGDVWENDARRALDTVAGLANGKPAVFVLGNAELSAADIDRNREEAARHAEAAGVLLLDDFERVLGGVRFVGGTLWTDGSLGRADPEHAALHRRTRGVIEDAMISTRSGPLVVVTHHAPHVLCLPEADRDHPDAGMFASDLSELTDDGRITLWVHGHIHVTNELIRPAGTRIVCNAVGQSFANRKWRIDLVVEI